MKRLFAADKKTKAWALCRFFARALMAALLFAPASCSDINDMLTEYNDNCYHEKIWSVSKGGSEYVYDATILIPEESYTVAQNETLQISLPCPLPSKWSLKYEDEDGNMHDVLDPADPEYSYASVYLNTGREQANNGQFYNTIIEISPAKTGLEAGTYTLSVIAWLLDTYYEDSAEVTVTE